MIRLFGGRHFLDAGSVGLFAGVNFQTCHTPEALPRCDRTYSDRPSEAQHGEMS
jgi:hypothetical protein